MQYLCKAEQQVRAKAYASAPDKDRMPHPGAPCLAEQASTGSASPARRLSTESRTVLKGIPQRMILFTSNDNSVYTPK